MNYQVIVSRPGSIRVFVYLECGDALASYAERVKSISEVMAICPTSASVTLTRDSKIVKSISLVSTEGPEPTF